MSFGWRLLKRIVGRRKGESGIPREVTRMEKTPETKEHDVQKDESKETSERAPESRLDPRD